MFERTTLVVMLVALPMLFISGCFILSIAKDIYVDVTYTKPDSDGTIYPEYRPYNSIQEAIDHAEDGDNIYVFPGWYNETLIVNKSVRIQALEKHNVTIWKKESSNKYIIEILADMVAIEDLEIVADSGCYVSAIYISGNTVTVQGNRIKVNGTARAVYVDSSTGNTIGNNIVEGGKGVYLISSSDNAIVNNQINNSTDSGIELRSSSNTIIYSNQLFNDNYGIYADDSENINITNNTIVGSKAGGVVIHDGEDVTILDNTFSENPTGLLFDASGGEIRGNTFESNNIGIDLRGSNANIYQNLITKSTLYGLYADKTSQNNLIYNNTFKYNSKNAIEKGENSWDNGEIGNYWDDYNDVDRDGDGIGDFSYAIPGGGIDRYPTGAFLKPPNEPELVSPKDGATNVGLSLELKVKVTDPDSDYLSVYFYDASNNTLLGVKHGIKSGGTASLSIRLPYDKVMAWYVVVNDSKLEATSDIWTFSTLPVPPTNKRPVADPGGPYSGKVNETIQFDGTKSYDPDGEIVFYRWNFGDGSGEILDPKPTHVYREPGRYTVTLTVIDNDGTSDTEATEVEIYAEEEEENIPPVADPGGPYSGKVNEPVQFDASGSYDSDGEIIEYIWDFGDGSTGFGTNPTHTYTKSGTFEVKLTVVDNNGGTSTASTYVEVSSKKKTPGFEFASLLLAVLAVLAILAIKKRQAGGGI